MAVGIVLLKGGLPMILRLVHFFWPIIAIYITYRAFRTWWRGQSAPTDPAGQPVIEICTKCGRPRQGLLHICRRIR